jgi:hypothetical protein
VTTVITRILYDIGKHGGVVVKAICYLILVAALGPGVYSASNRDEYQNQKNNVSEE